jgi:hypothetical protein
MPGVGLEPTTPMLELEKTVHALYQWSLTCGTRPLGGTRKHKTEEKIFIKIIRAKFRVSLNRPGRKDIRFGNTTSLSLYPLSYNFPLLKCLRYFINFYMILLCNTLVYMQFLKYVLYLYNLNYTPTILGVQGSKEITSGVTRTKKDESCYRRGGHCARLYADIWTLSVNPKRL